MFSSAEKREIKLPKGSMLLTKHSISGGKPVPSLAPQSYLRHRSCLYNALANYDWWNRETLFIEINWAVATIYSRRVKMTISYFFSSSFVMALQLRNDGDNPWSGSCNLVKEGGTQRERALTWTLELLVGSTDDWLSWRHTSGYLLKWPVKRTRAMSP